MIDENFNSNVLHNGTQILYASAAAVDNNKRASENSIREKETIR